MNLNMGMQLIGIALQSGKDHHIIESRGPGGEAAPGPLLTHCRGVVAAVPKFVKAKYLMENAKR